MYAIVEIAGQQFKVAKDRQIFVHRLDEKEGSKVIFDNVLLIDNDGKVNVGAPVIKEASVSAKVLEHMKADKVTVFKKKRRKGYKKKQGHRQLLTSIQITSIDEKGGAKKATSKAKAEEKPAAKAKAEKPAAKEAKPKAETKKTSKSTASGKKTAEKKPTAKKAADKPKTEAKKAASKKSGATAKKAAPKKAAPKKDDEKKKKE